MINKEQTTNKNTFSFYRRLHVDNSVLLNQHLFLEGGIIFPEEA